MTIFTDDFKTDPWWWEAVAVGSHVSDRFTASADVVIVGAGFTGLSAALDLARAGRQVLVLEQGAIGAGASSRNGGMIGSGHHLTFSGLREKYGEESARAIMDEGASALAYTTGLIEQEKIDCEYVRCGRFRAACSQAHFEAMRRENEVLQREINLNSSVVDKAGLPEETSTDYYSGGIVFHDHGGLHPAKFHAGLLGLARVAGARIVGRTKVTSVEKTRSGFEVGTDKGLVSAQHVVAATNGYTDGAFQRIRNRIVPAFSYIIATEPISSNLVKSAMPRSRMMVESRSLHGYYRPSPDGRRILFGGRAALRGIDQRMAAEYLRDAMVDLYPQLEGVGLSHCWRGQIAFTRDYMPHLGVRDGVHYALGYCGSGVAMAPYLGHRIAQKLLGNETEISPFESIGLPVIPFYNGWPWFLPLMDAWRSIRQRIGE